MSENVLAKLYEHNNWANLEVVRACSTLTDEQLDAEPKSVTKGTIRSTLVHLVGAQDGYLALLTIPLEKRARVELTMADLEQAITASGEGLLALASGERPLPSEERLRTANGYTVEPWVVMVQAINHATEHREQIKSMLTALDVTPPSLDGWDYGLATNALVPVAP